MANQRASTDCNQDSKFNRKDAYYLKLITSGKNILSTCVNSFLYCILDIAILNSIVFPFTKVIQILYSAHPLYSIDKAIISVVFVSNLYQGIK